MGHDFLNRKISWPGFREVVSKLAWIGLLWILAELLCKAQVVKQCEYLLPHAIVEAYQPSFVLTLRRIKVGNDTISCYVYNNKVVVTLTNNLSGHKFRLTVVCEAGRLVWPQHYIQWVDGIPHPCSQFMLQWSKPHRNGFARWHIPDPKGHRRCWWQHHDRGQTSWLCITPKPKPKLILDQGGFIVEIKFESPFAIHILPWVVETLKMPLRLSMEEIRKETWDS